MGFKARYQKMKNRQAKDWWSTTFGDPISWIILGFIGDIKWITPIGITWISFLCKVIPAGLLIHNERYFIVIGAILLQFGQVLDCMDGNLARYRNNTTLRGGFLDRILDGIGFVLVMSGFSWFTYQSYSEAYYLVLGPMAAAFYLVICYSYWTTAYHEQKYIGKANKVRPGGNVKSIQSISTLEYIILGQKKILSFKQADFYFWIGFGIILELGNYIILILFIVLFVRVIERIQSRYFYLKLLDKGKYQ